MIKFEQLVIPAASLGGTNPMPDIKNISYIHAGYKMTENINDEEKKHIGKGMISTMLPYRIQDEYDRNKQMHAFQAAIVENKHIRAVFLPELGGRLWSLFDKALDRELLYVNPVFQPGNLGLRNAWFSGGVEFNVGIKGHNPLTCSPMWCAVDKTSDGEILRLYEFERIRGIVYSISVWLPEDSKVLYLHNSIENSTEEEKYMYWWTNIAVPETKNTRVIVPTEESFLCFYNENNYLLDKISIPYYQSTDVSYPDNIPASRDFFYKIPEQEHKWIAAVDKQGKGLLQCSTQELKGRKLFVWGQGQGGRNWNEWLSEEGSAYIEIQAGLAHTQLEHIPMPAHSVWEWTEAYTALEENPEMLHGDYLGCVETVKGYIDKCVGNPDKIKFPSKDSVKETKIIYEGSGWGALEEFVRGRQISEIGSFPDKNKKEISPWKQLIIENTFPVPDTNLDPGDYVAGNFWRKKLEELPEQSWYSLLHLGVVCYAEGDIEGAKGAWENSIEKEKSPWALRNLSMLYKNELGDVEKARKYILQAFELKQDCHALCVEVADQLTTDGNDDMWLSIYDTLSENMRSVERLQLYCAMALIHLDRLTEATEILNKNFTMSDIKEGEMSVSHLWFELYRRLYAKEIGKPYSKDDTSLCEEADKKYPLPKNLDFRMH